MSLPSRTVVASVGLLWAVAGCAQAPRAPAAALEVPTRSLAAAEQQPLRALVVELLDRRGDAAPVMEAGEAAVVILEQVLNSPAETQTRRSRAVEVLGMMRVPVAEARLRALVQAEGTAGFLRGAAAVALAHRAGAKALTEIAALLEDPSAEVRLGSARALVVISNPEARAALEKRLSREPDPPVREAMQHHLTRMNP
ncbi:MAG: HEAT repeat domain-containing protein [Myxococcota bacterium]|nr:HEAT repeat domain-containing protein [Myxococcota bacterium]